MTHSNQDWPCICRPVPVHLNCNCLCIFTWTVREKTWTTGCLLLVMCDHLEMVESYYLHCFGLAPYARRLSNYRRCTGFTLCAVHLSHWRRCFDFTPYTTCQPHCSGFALHAVRLFRTPYIPVAISVHICILLKEPFRYTDFWPMMLVRDIGA